MNKHPIYHEMFSVLQLEKYPDIRLLRRVPPAAFLLDTEDARLESPIDFQLHITGTPNRVHLKGRVRAVVRLICDRCLQEYPHKVRVRFQTLFLRMSSPPDRSRRIYQPDDFITSYLYSDELDLPEIVREQILLNFPLKRLCRPDCLGLCPSCGVNRNETSCTCETDRVDPRWVPLEKILRTLS